MASDIARRSTFVSHTDGRVSIRVFDAHCHPTEVVDSLANIPTLRAAGLTVMSTRQEDQNLAEEAARKYGGRLAIDGRGDGKVVPCFGWHPWFAHTVIDDVSNRDIAELDRKDRKLAHYNAVLQPTPHYDDNEEDRLFVDGLPEPLLLSQLVSDTRDRLRRFPAALVGEIGIDKSFRLPNPWPKDLKDCEGSAVYGNLTPGNRAGRTLSRFRTRMTHQKAVFESQLRLAGEVGRPASVHSVGAHGAALEVLSALWKGHARVSKRQSKRDAPNALAPSDEIGGPGPFPPRLCMHSYSGPVEQLSQWLHPSVPIDVYFSFSTFVNFDQKDQKQADRQASIIQTVPDGRILAETDLHMAGSELDDALEKVANEICRLKGWSPEDGERRLNENWRRFAFG